MILSQTARRAALFGGFFLIRNLNFFEVFPVILPSVELYNFGHSETKENRSLRSEREGSILQSRSLSKVVQFNGGQYRKESILQGRSEEEALEGDCEHCKGRYDRIFSTDRFIEK